uniref:NOC3-like protein n=2 Tax=Mesocestoides corti TaxID=53468 RepID=A0A5K3FGN3_MESCO
MEACGGDGAGLSAAERLFNKQRYIKVCKLKIAQYSSSVVEDPNANVGRLRDLMKMATDPLFLKSRSLRHLLVASLCVVFKDILPTYKIRLPTEQELKQKVKKETKRLWRFEEILLKNFEKYVLLLQTILQDKERRRLPKSLRIYSQPHWSTAELVSALKCACSLFENNPLFNFSEDLLRSATPYLQDSRNSVRQIVFGCLRSTFAADVTGQSTLMVCRAVHRLARSVNYRILPDVANVIAGIAIREVADSTSGNSTHKDRKFASRRERKKDKVLAKFEKDQAETKATKSHEERLRINAEILKEILFVYFKILKTTKDSELLSAVLAGLSTYAHIINVDYVENLLQLISIFVANPKTSLHDGLHCVHTALTILNTSSATSVLHVDPTRFYNHLYALLGQMAGVSSGQAHAATRDAPGPSLMQYAWARTPAAIAAETLARREQLLGKAGDEGGAEAGGRGTKQRRIRVEDAERFTDVILACLDMLIVNRKREVSANRVLAFAKRLASLAVAISDPACQGSMLVSLWKFISLFPKCEVLFDSETEIGGDYDPEALDPELARPASSALWELQVLRQHESPLVRRIVAIILRWVQEMTKTSTPRPTNEVLAQPDHTIESLSTLHPAERRVILARSEAACLSTPSTAKVGKRRYQPSPWLRRMLEQNEEAATLPNGDESKVVKMDVI